MIEIKNIEFSHHHNDKPVLKGVTFNAEKGRLTAILGPNGSGKTTLFNCILGLWMPQKGDIFYDGQNIVSWKHEIRAKIISFVPQEHEPPFPYSVFDVVLMGRTVYINLFSLPSENDYKKAIEAIELVGIRHLKDFSYTEISGGERQLVLIARAIAQDSPVILLDEPTSHLDFKNQIMILSKLKKIIKERGLITIMTIHDPNIAMLFADKIIMINDGMVVADGEPDTVITEANLKKLYGIDVKIVSFDGLKFIVPTIAKR